MFFLIRQVQDLRMQFATKTDTDDQIMVAVNAKVEEWKVCALLNATLIPAVKFVVEYATAYIKSE